MRRISLLAALLASTAAGVRAAEAPATRPNILFLIADDLSYHSVGYMGDPVIESPHIDRLAHEGVVFTHAEDTTAICMVTRANLLTGRYLSVMGGARVTPKTWPDTWPARLRAAGYYGGHVGKIHVKGQPPSGYDFWAGRTGYSWLKDEYGNPVHSIQRDTEKALQFLRQRPRDQPFFLQVAYTVPHAEDKDPRQYLPMPQEEHLYLGATVPVPETAKAEYWDRMPYFFHRPDNESRRRWTWRFDTPAKYQEYTKNYYRLISGMDRSIGVILGELAAEGASSDTVVVFMGDNGYFLGEHGLADKWYAYEESVRVPLLIYDPRQPASERGRRCDDLALNIDLAPTFCALAGLKPPPVMQGRSLLPLTAGAAPGDWRHDFLYQFKWRSEVIPASEAVCSKEWKYIRWVVTNTEELFDLRSDPHEVRNLAADPAHAADLRRFRARLAELRRQVGGSRIEDLTAMPYGP